MDSNQHHYNIRFGDDYPVHGDLLSARFLVLYGNSKFEHTHIFELDHLEGKLMSKDSILKIKPFAYPNKPSQDFYFVYKLKKKIELGPFEFNKENQLVKEKLVQGSSTFLPFTLTLKELLEIRG
jgi:hypothetical protein